jgi:hypothetical protein
MVDAKTEAKKTDAKKTTAAAEKKPAAKDSGKVQHVTPHPDGGWQVKGAGNTRATARFKTKEEAEKKAKEIAKNQDSRIVSHRKDGTIQKKR